MMDSYLFVDQTNHPQKKARLGFTHQQYEVVLQAHRTLVPLLLRHVDRRQCSRYGSSDDWRSFCDPFTHRQELPFT